LDRSELVWDRRKSSILEYKDMGCNYSCIDPDYLNQPLEVRIDEKTYAFQRRPKDLRSLYCSVPEIMETSASKATVFEYSSNEGVKQLTNDLFLHEAYITHCDRKLVIGTRMSYG
jgi:hypothetical protein